MWQLVKSTFFTEPSIAIVAAFGLGLALLAVRRLRRLGAWWIAAMAATFGVLSLPWTADRLVSGLSREYGPLATAAGSTSPGRPVSIVVLAGDHLLNRVQDAARLYRALDPPWIVMSGWDEHIYAGLIDAGVPEDRLVFESKSRTTREQIANLGAVLTSYGIERCVVVVSALQARRVAATLEAAGLQAMLSAAAVPPHWQGGARFVPRAGALRLSEEALYEYAALAYYRGVGWTR